MKVSEIDVKKGQIWLDPRTGVQYVVKQKKGDGWRMAILTNKRELFGKKQHTFHKFTFKKLELIA